jgi:hypothetical protein
MNFLKMSSEIFKITIKHTVYEWCIDIIFKHILKNFPSTSRRIPEIGEKYVYIRELTIDETYYNCLIIDPKKIDDYNLLDEEEKQDLVFAIMYKRLIYKDEEGGVVEIFGDGETATNDGFQYFTTSDMEVLEFKQ